ncbi:hypothetical protein M9782_03605 [Pectobacterium actinidiae]|uniref:DUF2575 domain-containing protein n=1 Tax=Pectobacterium actinidiae TaxID=1507808 RepID=A0ABW8GG78_9GAMM|nr:hypothetical protein [Pectobacterium actinidiae]GKW16865.1 hypothetical protein PEC301937_28140 [Pectobacterium carotovorum subsp. carotovorum]KHN90001.1 hypothetical protein KKH3_00280 [Pectobacterium actinidiae]MDY4317235.1 hypothetical protein [Pectobacterium actinidiae]WEF12389.1 hypothetical protein M9782_03605 [Pectobacterium actinidiae]GLW39563.1 hypothetical protein Pcaca04_34990 [Pectobacterium carotovorum subsp. carotovorum]
MLCLLPDADVRNSDLFFTEADPFRALSLLRVVGKVGGFIFRPQLAGLSFSYV